MKIYIQLTSQYHILVQWLFWFSSHNLCPVAAPLRFDWVWLLSQNYFFYLHQSCQESFDRNLLFIGDTWMSVWFCYHRKHQDNAQVQKIKYNKKSLDLTTIDNEIAQLPHSPANWQHAMVPSIYPKCIYLLLPQDAIAIQMKYNYHLSKPYYNVMKTKK